MQQSKADCLISCLWCYSQSMWPYFCRKSWSFCLLCPQLWWRSVTRWRGSHGPVRQGRQENPSSWWDWSHQRWNRHIWKFWLCNEWKQVCGCSTCLASGRQKTINTAGNSTFMLAKLDNANLKALASHFPVCGQKCAKIVTHMIVVTLLVHKEVRAVCYIHTHT